MLTCRSAVLAARLASFLRDAVGAPHSFVPLPCNSRQPMMRRAEQLHAPNRQLPNRAMGLVDQTTHLQRCPAGFKGLLERVCFQPPVPP